MALQYRPEIDGLRAVAVVPVILFHAGFTLFSGGFIGVDVFFVISGYLITSIILRELEAGTFTFASFYERRARRILPALFLVMLCCIPFAWMWMMPLELKGFAVSVTSVVVFASNIVFWRQSGYFDTASELKPLLHTWSLAVEEQFYIIFPIALLLIWRFGRKASVLSIAAVAIASLVLCEYASRYNPSFNFYWAVTRTWELLAGALCAFVTLRSKQTRDNSLSALGLMLILVSSFWFDSSARFPSVYALLPVAGACLTILFANRDTFAAWLLSRRPLVAIGLVSYSAYLWHQPLFAFARIRSIVDPSMWLMGGLAFAVFPLAWLTWRYVEIPFRTQAKHSGVTRMRLILASTAATIALCAFGVAGHLTWGFPNRLSESISVAQERVRVNYGLSEECDTKFTLSIKCRTSDNPPVLLWGDSFAMHLAGMLKKANPPIEFVQTTISSCSPIINVTAGKVNSDIDSCSAFNKQVFDWLRKADQIKLVIISSPFESTIKGNVRINHSQETVAGSETLLAAALKQTIKEVRSIGKDVLVVAPPPLAGFGGGDCLRKSIQFSFDPKRCNFTVSMWPPATTKVYSVLRDIESDATVIWPHKWICSVSECNSSKQGVWIYRDWGHLIPTAGSGDSLGIPFPTWL